MTEAEGELLIYALPEHRAHALNPTLTAVWRLCDGRQAAGDALAALRRETGHDVAPAVLALALKQLHDAHLLATDMPHEAQTVLPAGVASRRALLTRVGRVSASALLLPTITSIVAPRAVAAASGGGSDGGGSGEDDEDVALFDPFQATTLNEAWWRTTTSGTGPFVERINERLEIALPGSSSGGGFAAGYMSVFRLRGDFDVDVRYGTVAWPSTNGVRIGITADPNGSATQHTGFGISRVSFGSANDFPGYPREVYISGIEEQLSTPVATTDLAGGLRIKRVGSTLSAYYLEGDQWTLANSGSGTTADLYVGLRAWSANDLFTDRDVRVFYKDFYVRTGTVIT